jgi:hypothetical protein
MTAMPPSEDTPPRPEPAPRRSRVDAWEAVVRQELVKARRRRPARLLAKGGLDRVIPALRENRPGDPPKEPT